MSREVAFSDFEMAQLRAAAAARGVSQTEFVRHAVLRLINPGWSLTADEDRRLMEAARALNTSKHEFVVRAIMQACSEVECGDNERALQAALARSPFRQDTRA